MPLAPLYERTLEAPEVTYRLRLAQPNSERWLVLVHGIGREVDGLQRWFGGLASQHGYNLLLPMFDEKRFRDYQRLGRDGLGERADTALLAMMEDVRGMGMNLPDRVPIFGFSGGAQFAHRFALAHGGRVQSLICAAAGWYTPLRPKTRYPYGLGRCARLEDLAFCPERLLAMPTLTLVGELDRERDDTVRDRRRLNVEQGETRLERANWWHKHLRRASRRRGVAPQHELQVMPNCGHNLRDCALHGALAERVFDFVERAAQPALPLADLQEAR